MEGAQIVAQSDAEMTIDYDQPLHAVASAAEAGGDAEMGLDVTAPHDGVMTAATATDGLDAVTASLPDYTGEQEAEMRDDGSVPEVDASIVDDSALASIEVMLEDNNAEATMPAEVETTTTEPLADISFTAADEAVMTTTAAAPLDTATMAPLASFDLTADATLAPEAAFTTASEVSLPDETLAVDGPVAAADEITTQDAPVDPAPPLVPTVGDGGAAARDLELPETVTAPEALDRAAEFQEATSADSAPVATEEDPLAGGVPPLFEIASEKLAEQVDEAQAHGRDAEEASSKARPAVDKDPLLQVEIPAEDLTPEASTSAARLAPGVLVTCGGTTYCLFRQLQVANESTFTEDDDEEEGAIKPDADDRSASEEDAPMILDELAQHDLYYQPVERLLETLRSKLPELDGEADELVLDFEDLGITLGEVSTTLTALLIACTCTDSRYVSPVGQCLHAASLALRFRSVASRLPDPRAASCSRLRPAAVRERVQRPRATHREHLFVGRSGERSRGRRRRDG